MCLFNYIRNNAFGPNSVEEILLRIDVGTLELLYYILGHNGFLKFL
jgi:hypothetical protein